MSYATRRSLLGIVASSIAFGALNGPLRARHTENRPIRIVTLGDSITKGVRPGVSASETFAALLQARSLKAGFSVEVDNVGIGGERTDQALARLDQDVLAKSPDIVIVMYGANDSYVDPGKTAPRLSQEVFRKNLETIVDRLQARSVQVILMTEPRWGAKAKANGIGEHPNTRMEGFMTEVRETAKARSLHLVDHYAIWTLKESQGIDLGSITTDQLHPNPAGHRLLADSIWPTIEPILKKANSRLESSGSCAFERQDAMESDVPVRGKPGLIG